MKYFVSKINTYYVEYFVMGTKARALDEFIMDTEYNTIIIKLRKN